MAIPDYQTFMLPVLKILGDNVVHTNHEIIEILADEFKITEEERKEIYGGNNTKIIFNDRIAWARTYLKKAGLIYYPERLLNKITEAGLNVLKTNPETINYKFLTQFESFKHFRNGGKDETELVIVENCEVNKTPDEMIQDASSTLQSLLENELMSRILENSPTFFEKMVAKLLLAMGYGGSEKDILQNRGKSGDEGIDGIIKQDVLGLDKIYIQAKRWNGNVSRPEIQKFVGAVHGQNATRGIFITTSSFTSEAKEYAKNINSNIILIDGALLTSLMIKYNVGVQIKNIIEIKKLDIDFFDED